MDINITQWSWPTTASCITCATPSHGKSENSVEPEADMRLARIFLVRKIGFFVRNPILSCSMHYIKMVKRFVMPRGYELQDFKTEIGCMQLGGRFPAVTKIEAADDFAFLPLSHLNLNS
jgi:hypothetical protein